MTDNSLAMMGLALIISLAAVSAAMQCRDLTIPVSISARNAEFNLKPLHTQVEVTDFFMNLTQPGGDAIADLLQGVCWSQD